MLSERTNPKHASDLLLRQVPHAAEPYHLFNVQTSNGLVGEESMAVQRSLTPLNHAVSAARSALIPAGIFSLFINSLALVSPLYMLQVYDRVLSSRNSDDVAVPDDPRRISLSRLRKPGGSCGRAFW